MKDLNDMDENQELERLNNINVNKDAVKNDCFVTRYIYESKGKAQEGPLNTKDDPHSIQRRRYFNPKRVN